MPVSGVASVCKTSGRRFANVLDVSGSSRWTRLQNVLDRNVFHTLSIRVRFRCCFSFQNVRKTFYRRTGRLWFVTLETSSTRFGYKRLSHVIRTCPFQVLLQFSKRQEDVLQTYWTFPVCQAGHVFNTL